MIPVPGTAASASGRVRLAAAPLATCQLALVGRNPFKLASDTVRAARSGLVAARGCARAVDAHATTNAQAMSRGVKDRGPW